jgi:DNA-binding IclR family transcriptional regulator
MKTQSQRNATTTLDPGTIERTMEMLRLLATAGRYGLALTQISEAAKLPNSTAHRLLHRLIAERMVVQLESNKRYVLGPLTFELGLAASKIYDLREPCRAILTRLAEEIEDMVYLTVRSGNESVCEGRYEGPSAIRVVTLEVGSRRPLGLGAGGLAMVAAMPKDEVEQTIAYLTSRYPDNRALQKDALRKAIADYNRHGYSYIKSQVTLGTSAVGVAILDTLNNPIAAVSVAAVDSRMSKARVDMLGKQLQVTVTHIRESLHRFQALGN